MTIFSGASGNNTISTPAPPDLPITGLELWQWIVLIVVGVLCFAVGLAVRWYNDPAFDGYPEQRDLTEK